MDIEERADAKRILPSDWWALALVVLCYGFYNLDKSLISVLIEPIKREFRLTDADMGLITGLATSVPFALACIPVGILADRVNRRNLLAALIGGWSIVTGLTSLAASPLGLFASRVGIGAFEAGFTPAALSSLSDRFPARLRGTAMGVFNLGGAAGVLMGMAIGGVIEDAHGWRSAFLVAGIPGLFLAVTLFLTTGEPARGRFDEEQTPGREGLRDAVVQVFGDRAVRHIALGMTWGAAMLAVFAVWTPSLMRRTFELSATAGGLQAGLIVGLGGALGATLGGIASDRLGHTSLARRLLVPIGGVLLSAVAGLTALLAGPGPAVTALLLGIGAFCCQTYIGPCYGLVVTLAKPTRRGVTLSLLLVSFNLISYSAGSGVIGKISDLLTPAHGAQALRYAFAIAFLFCIFAALHFTLAYRELARREAA